MEVVNLSTQERLNLAITALETQRKRNDVLENEKNDIQNQLNKSNQSIMQLIHDNIELKEHVQALTVENSEMVKDIQNYEEKMKSVELVSDIGSHLVEAINKITMLNEINKK